MTDKKGISLIVLVITIIVMIILVAVLIISLSNVMVMDNASKAVEDSNESNIKNLVALAWSDAFFKETEETKDNDYYLREIKAQLISKGIAQDEIDKYDIIATTKGAEAKLKNQSESEKTEQEILHAGTVPEGATYYVGVTSMTEKDYTGATATYTAGQNFPTEVNDGDVYVYGNYEYRYNYRYVSSWSKGYLQNGWGVRCINDVALPGELIENINGMPLKAIERAFKDCTNITTAPTIPSTVSGSMTATFSGCTSLVDAGNVIVPEGVTDLYVTFADCTSLEVPPDLSKANNVTMMEETFRSCISLTDMSSITIPTTSKLDSLSETFARCIGIVDASSLVIPDNITSLYATFSGCKNLTIAPRIPSKIESMNSTFHGCVSLETSPAIPSSIKTLSNTFSSCTRLTTAPDLSKCSKLLELQGTFRSCTALKTYSGSTYEDGDFSHYIIPDSVYLMNYTFEYCKGVVYAPTIPQSVWYFQRTFFNCTSLTGTLTVNTDNITNVIEYESGSCYECLYGTTQPIIIGGTCSSTVKSLLAGTANNNNVTY